MPERSITGLILARKGQPKEHDVGERDPIKRAS